MSFTVSLLRRRLPAMLARVVHPIGEDDTSEMAERALAVLGADLLLSTVAALASGHCPPPPCDPGGPDVTRPATEINDPLTTQGGS